MLDDKCAVVTGSARGIGRAAAIEMARQGARGIVVTDRDTKGGEETVRMIEDAGGRATFLPCDLRDSSAIDQLMDEAAAAYDGIDILHNNAGLIDSDLVEDSSIDGFSIEAWDAIMDVNLKAVWLCSRAALKYLRESPQATIVNVGSVSSTHAYPKLIAYSTSKAAVVALTKMLAVELSSDGIRCVAYCPGPIETEMLAVFMDDAEDRRAAEESLGDTLLARKEPLLGQPSEVAKFVCFLASEDALFINGSAHMIDGGSLSWRGHHGTD